MVLLLGGRLQKQVGIYLRMYTLSFQWPFDFSRLYFGRFQTSTERLAGEYS